MTGRRLLIAIVILVILTHLGAWGFYRILDERVSYFHCVYRTVLLITTVNEPIGFPDLAPDRRRLLEHFTVVVLLTGMGVVLYAVSTFAAWMIEGDLRGRVRKRRVRRMIERRHDHIIVCGGGRTGELMMAELTHLTQEFIVIETDADRVETLELAGYMVLRGDATQDHVLEEAGIASARGIIAALPGDTDNLFVVITARQLNPKVKIVARSIDPSTDSKLFHAGANVVVGANEIAANRMVSSLVRPHVVTFIDRLMRDPDSTNRIEEVVIEPGSDLDGVTLGDSQVGARLGMLVLAIQPDGQSRFIYNPGATTLLGARARLVVLGELANLAQLREMAGGD